MALPSHINTKIAQSFKETAAGEVAQRVCIAEGPPNGSAVYTSETAVASGGSTNTGWLNVGDYDRIRIYWDMAEVGTTMQVEWRDADDKGFHTATYTSLNFVEMYSFEVMGDDVRLTFTNPGTGSDTLIIHVRGYYGSSSGTGLPMKVDPPETETYQLTRSVVSGKSVENVWYNQRVTAEGAALVADFGIEVSRNVYDSLKYFNVRGYNRDVDIASAEDIIASGGDHAGFDVVTAANMSLVSSSANDQGSRIENGSLNAGSGATTVIDTSATFVSNGVSANDLYVNITQRCHGYVVSVDSETQLTITEMQGEEGASYTNATGNTYAVFTATSTGAAVVRISSLYDGSIDPVDAIYYQVSGTLPNLVAGAYYRSHKAEVVLAGSNGANVGAISCTIGGNNTWTILAGENASKNCVDTVPRNKIGVLRKVSLKAYRSGATGYVRVGLLTRQYGGVWITREEFVFDTETPFDYEFDGGFLIPGGSDFKLRVLEVEEDDTAVIGSFEWMRANPAVLE